MLLLGYLICSSFFCYGYFINVNYCYNCLIYSYLKFLYGFQLLKKVEKKFILSKGGLNRIFEFLCFFYVYQRVMVMILGVWLLFQGGREVFGGYEQGRNVFRFIFFKLLFVVSVENSFLGVDVLMQILGEKFCQYLGYQGWGVGREGYEEGKVGRQDFIGDYVKFFGGGGFFVRVYVEII